MSNRLWTDGKRVRVASHPRDNERQVDPTWLNSPAKVLRHIGRTQNVSHTQLVAIRRKCIASSGDGVNPAHVAIGFLMLLQDGNDLDRLLAISDDAWRQMARAFDLQD